MKRKISITLAVLVCVNLILLVPVSAAQKKELKSEAAVVSAAQKEEPESKAAAIEKTPLDKDAGAAIKKPEAAALDTGYSVGLARQHLAEGNPNKAVDLCKKMIGKEPNSASLHSVYAQALTECGKHEEALKEWQKAFELDKSNLYFKQRIGDWYFDKGDYKKAKGEFEELEKSAGYNNPSYKNYSAGKLLAIENKLKEIKPGKEAAAGKTEGKEGKPKRR